MIFSATKKNHLTKRGAGFIFFAQHRFTPMQFNFQPFLSVGGSYAPKVSIRSNGSLGLSQGLMHRYKLTEGDWYACLFFDPEKRAMGIKFTQDESVQGATKVHTRSMPSKSGQKNWSGHIAARAFLDYYGIDFQKPERPNFTPEWNDEFGGLVVLLDGPCDTEPDSSEEGEDLGSDPPSGGNVG
jgi:hypothetical protein